MDKHCKGCRSHNNAGHPKGSPYARYNDWCCKFGDFAAAKIGHCKLHNAKTTA